jgi:ubiquinone/menaquinone biosynthesis C-methylase UbiE
MVLPSLEEESLFSVDFVNKLRSVEVEKVAELLPAGARVLEIGAGTGRQARDLQARGFTVTAIEVPGSIYAGHRVYPIKDYDGRTLPFADRSFDAVFSSNVLEHVADLKKMHSEIARVLKINGCAVHVMPTHTWRFWTLLTSVPSGFQRAFSFGWKPVAILRALASGFLQKRHGERGNAISEIYYFHPFWWLKNFKQSGFVVTQHEPAGVFYTGNLLFGPRWSIEQRAKIARRLGSPCHIFKVEPRLDS